MRRIPIICQLVYCSHKSSSGDQVGENKWYQKWPKTAGKWFEMVKSGILTFGKMTVYQLITLETL